MRSRRGEQGFVLIAPLWVLAIATIVALSFGRRAFLAVRAAQYDLEQTEARMAARGAVQRGIIEIRNKFYKDLLQEETDGQRTGTHLGQPWARERNLLGPEMYDWGPDFQYDQVVYRIVDADRYINVNTASDDLIENIPQLSRSVKRRIKTRREEEVHEGDGVARFQAVEELRYLRGMDDEEWFGEDGEIGVRDLLSVYGGPRININTAPREVLECIPELGEAAIEDILFFRGDPPNRGFSNIDEVQQFTSISGDALQAIKDYCSFNSSFYIITGYATRQGGKVRVQSRAVLSFSGGAPQIVDWQERAIGA